MEENFKELLENYLDDLDIESKKEIDKENVKEVNHKYLDKIDDKDVITIEAFVNEYLNIKSNASKLLHCGLKDLNCPYVVGVSNEFASKNMDLVKKGYLLVVVDFHHNKGTYLNPFYLKKLLTMGSTLEEYNLFMKKRLNDLQMLEDYYTQYITLKNQVETNELFYKVLKEQKKCNKLNKIRTYESIGEENDKHQRR
jgi:hypothetical protein